MKLKHRLFRTPTRSHGRPAPAPVSTIQAIGLTIELGSLMAVSVLLGLVGGQALDGYFGTEPVMMLLGVVAGLACTFLGTLRQYRAAARLRAAELAAANDTQRPAEDVGNSSPSTGSSASSRPTGG